MGSDRARVSYDPSRHWRGVIAQQGRVTLEADVNEAATIAAEENREQLLDVVGPAGTPDDGYRVAAVVDGSGDATGDLTIGAGTMYVGGERVFLDDAVDYGDQSEWLDRAGDPLWQEPSVPQGSADESVYLLLREQEVGSVEDPALLDVALGGPDTTGRLRIVQRVVRAGIDGSTCADGLSALEDDWQGRGLSFDSATMRLESSARLQVGFQQDPQAATPCEPVAQGGYLGAENQLIRVQVAGVDESGRPTLVWGFDNAYFLYRVTVGAVDDSGSQPTTVLTLANAPVDAYHQPVKGQAVEVLEAAAKLTDDDYVAQTTGIFTTVDTAYQPDTQELVIATALAAPTTDSPVLFLRVWQDSFAYDGGAVPLGTTGLQVTLTGSGAYHPGDYWVFAVRPGTPTTASPIYPRRIHDAPQPPDGPRMWACPLAVVDWADGEATVTDCRDHFDDLVTLTEESEGCCIDVTPERVHGGAGLQTLIDRYAQLGPVTVCLRPGTYSLPKPLVIGKGHAGVTLNACAPGVVLEAENAKPIFLLGLILLEEPARFALRGVELRLPHVALGATVTALREALKALPSARRSLVLEYLRGLRVSIGVYLLGGRDVTIEGCTFVFTPSTVDYFGAGVFAAREVVGLELVDNRFQAADALLMPLASVAAYREARDRLQVIAGYLHLPTSAQTASFGSVAGMVEQRHDVRPSRSPARGQGAASRRIAAPVLADATIEKNLFQGLTMPVLVVGRVGTVRIEENTVRDCYAGFWLVHTGSAAALALIERVGSAGPDGQGLLSARGIGVLGDPVLLLAAVTARILPLTPDEGDPSGSIGIVVPPTKTMLADAKNVFRRVYTAARWTDTVSFEKNAAAAEPAAAPVEQQQQQQQTAPQAEEAVLPEELNGIFTSVQTGGQTVTVDTGTDLELRLNVSGNQVDAVVADSDSGAGLLVAAFDEHPSTLICSGNRLRSRVGAGVTALLLELTECAVTGNLVDNDAGGDGGSLVLLPRLVQRTPAVAVTGNVLVGRPILPNRPLQTPFHTWAGLNTVIV